MRKKPIQAILTKNIHLVGKQGQIINVKPGYIRNYLIPSKLGKLATPNLINQYNVEQQKLAFKEKQSTEKYTKFKEMIDNLEKFIIKKKISENGKFFGKITKKQILDLINNKIGGTVELTKNQLELPKMKEVGNYSIPILLSTNIIANINIKILPE